MKARANLLLQVEVLELEAKELQEEVQRITKETKGEENG